MVGRILKLWVPIAFAATALAGTTYLTVQQNYRLTANDPQIQMAEDISASSLDTAVKQISASTKIDISASLSPFVVIFDNNGNVLASDATLNGQTPSLPSGVLDYVKSHGEDRVTWQPQNGVRIAAVINPSKTAGFVLVGRNLREVEIRENNLNTEVFAGLSATIFGSLFLIMLLETIFPEKRK